MNSNKKKNKKKLILYALSLIILISILGFFIKNSFSLNKQKVINYTETSNLDYKVYLKKNNFYEEEYLNKGMVYVSSLIDKIKMDFNYNFNIEEPTNLIIKYKIIGTLYIQDRSGKNKYFEKKYVLVDDKINEIINSTNANILETVEIDYNYYNKIANNFKNNYGIETSSNFVVSLIIEKVNNNDNLNLFINNNVNNMNVFLPLSEKSVNISLDYKDINNQSNVVKNKASFEYNYLYLTLSILIIIIVIVTSLKFAKIIKNLLPKKSKYDKYISKLLREYDRLVVETSMAPNLLDKEVIVIKEFGELLDVRDNLKQPIMYYIEEEHKKCYFYIDYFNKVYITTLNSKEINSKHKNN